MVSLADLSVSTPGTDTPEEGSAGEEQKEEGSNGFNKDLDSPHNAGAASAVKEEEELKVENAAGPVLLECTVVT